MLKKIILNKILANIFGQVCFLFYLALSCSFLYGQEYKFESLTTDNGLSQNLVYDIFQDSRNFLWIATADGLNRYDGNSFRIFKSTPDNQNTISGHHFSSIVEDKEGNLWIGSYGEGLNKYLRMTESFTSVKHDPKNSNTPIGNRITSLIIDRNNYLWIGTESGLSRLNLSTGKYRHFKADINNPDSLCHERVYNLYEDSEGKIWIGTWSGLSMYDPVTKKFKSFLQKERDPHLTTNDYIHSVYEDKRKNLWVGTAQGLYLLNRKNNSVKKFKHDPANPNTINDETIQDIIEDSHGNLWIATFYGGLNLYDRDKKIFYHYKQNPYDPTSLSSNVVHCLLEDKSGILWIGTMDGGVNKLDFRKAQFRNYKTEPYSKNSITNNHISSILVDKDNSIWVGTLGGGINNLVRSKIGEKYSRSENYQLDQYPIYNNLIYSITRDSNNNIWFGTEGGLAKFNPGEKIFKLYNSHTNLSMINNTVFKVLEGRDGKIWIGTYGGGISYLDEKTDKFISYRHNAKNPKSIATDIVRNILEDSNQNMWICTEDGLDFFDRKKNEFVHFRNNPNDPGSIVDNKILLVFESSKKELWVGTPFGLCKLTGDINNPATVKFTRLSQRNGLAGNSIQGIQEDNHGNLWISTNDGISQYDPVNGTINNFNVFDGVISNEFYVTACAKIRSTGEMIFGSNKGLVTFNPENIKKDLYIPPVVLTGLSVSNVPVPIQKELNGNLILDRSITETSEIHLAHNQTEITIEFAALNYANPQDNKFKYKIEGLDSNWYYLGNRRLISLTNIEPGDYTFRLTAANHSGVWNDKGVSLKIIVDPPFYKTFVFRTLAILGFIGLILLVHNHRTKNIQKRSQELQEEVNKRTSELTFTNKQLHDEVIERIKVEEKLRRAKEAAEGASRSKSEFLANISHELRTPLNAILGYAQIMRKHSEVTSKHKDQLLIIQQNGEHLLTLINDILDLRRIEMKREVINQKEMHLPLLIKEVVDSIKIKALEKKLDFEYNESSSVPDYVLGDSKKLKQILINLLGNAVKYTNKGFVRLTINSENLDVAQAKKKIKFIIEDSGIGIPKEKYTDIFLPFKSNDGVKENIDSVGLGLAISKRLVEFLGGNLKFSSSVAQGTTFSFELEFDVVKSSSHTEKKFESSFIRYSGEKQNVLIVDDNPTNCLMLEAMLEPVGFKIQQASSGQTALDIAETFNPDLILLDLLMPGMSGKEFVNLYRKNTKNKIAKVVGVSAAVADKARINEFSLVCDAFVSKPIDTDLLLKIIGEQLNLSWEKIGDQSALISTKSFAWDENIQKPNKEILDEIKSKVNMGDFAGVNKIINSLSEQEGYSQFCDVITKLSKAFDEDAIIQLCKN